MMHTARTDRQPHDRTIKALLIALLVLGSAHLIASAYMHYAYPAPALECFCCEHTIDPGTNPEALLIDRKWYCSAECYECMEDITATNPERR